MFVGGLRRMVRDAAPISTLLFACNLQLRRRRRGALSTYTVHRFTLPPGCQRVGLRRFTVDLDKVTTYCGFSYVPGGWSPATALLREYEQDPSLKYEDSVLYRLYERFTPATVREALFDHSDHGDHGGPADHADDPLSPLDRLPARHQVMKHLWNLDARTVERLQQQAPHQPVIDDHSRYFGPKTHTEGAGHFERFTAVYDSIRTHGYRPDDFGGGTAEGFFLVRGDDYRFVISRANHRVPALRALGVRRIVARPLVGHPPVVDEAQLHRWSTGSGGAYPLATTRALFDAMFTTTGTERAQALGLHEPSSGRP